MNHVLITSRSLGSGTVDIDSEIKNSGCTLSRGPANHDLAQLASSLATATAWIAGTGPITKEHLDHAPNLKIIARYGVGVEAVDLGFAKERGIAVTNTPGANSDAVAELSIGLMLSALRHVAFGDSQVRADKWETITGQELGALTVGVVGFGRIGQGVARKLTGFGSKVIAFDPYATNEAFNSNVARASTLEELITKCDVITLHAPGNEVLLSGEALKTVKPGVIVINTARAGLVDEHALATALRERAVGSYAADVLSVENTTQVSPLLAGDLKKFVTLTPHIGAQTMQAIDKMGSMAWANVKAVLAGKPPINPVETEQ